jgi:mono/diheme cytochrome c family protein
VRRRLSLLVSIGFVAVATAACGRATEDQINQILGITPTATMSAEQIASATEAAEATEAARVAAASTPGGATAGDVASGGRQFQTWCVGCHGPGGSGPDLLAAGGPGASVTPDSLLPLIREGTGHPQPPGPYRATEITDRQIVDLAAYLNAEAVD